MPIERLSYAALADRLKVTPEAARSLVKRLRLPRSRSNDGKTLVAVDLAEIAHKPMPARSSGGDQPVTTLRAKIEALEVELTKLEAFATTHRADFERERDRAELLVTELLKVTGDLLAAREVTARLEGEIAALRPPRRWSWRWLRSTG